MELGVEIRYPPFTGQANHVRAVVSELRTLGHEVKVILGLPDGLWETTDLETFRRVPSTALDRGLLHGLERGVRRLQSTLNLPYLGWFEAARFALVVRRGMKGCDVLYERFSWMGYGGALASRWLRIPLVIEDNGDHLKDLEAKGTAPAGLQRELALRLMATVVRRAALVISSGEGWRKHFLARWGCSATKVTVVENGTSLVGLLSREQLQAFQDDRPKDMVRLIYVGGFDPWHGIEILLEAVRRARLQMDGLRLTLIGSGVGWAEAKHLVDDLTLGEVVELTGQLPVEQVALQLADADIGVSPYCGWSEYSGLKIFDYKAAGVPTIASGEGGQPATLEHGRTGWIVPPCDEAALTEAILLLAGDATLRRGLGRQARIEAEAIHSWARTARQIEHCLLELVCRDVPNQEIGRQPSAARGHHA